MEFVVADAIVQLRAAGCVFAEEEAAILADAAGHHPERMQALVKRRATGEPLEQVVGYADFCGIRVKLRPGVFVPRVRSELLVRIAAQQTQSQATVVDLCCGSGALGLALRQQRPHIDLYAADSDSNAVACARDNLGSQVFQGNLFEALPPDLKIDVLLANVPYVATRHIPFLPAEARDHEPHTALDGGQDGLDVFRAVLKEAGQWLREGGLLLSEITQAQIATAVQAIEHHGLHPAVHSDEDLAATVVTATQLNR